MMSMMKDVGGVELPEYFGKLVATDKTEQTSSASKTDSKTASTKDAPDTSTDAGADEV